MKRYIVLLLFAGCAEQAYYVPTDNVSATSPGGKPAASYVIQGENGGKAAEVNVWSRGVDKRNDASLLHATFEVRNTSDAPLKMDPSLISAEAFGSHDTPMQTPRLAGTSPSGPDAFTIPPHQARNIDVYFSTAPGIKPSDVKAFRMRWGLQLEGQQYVQFTQFKREVPEYYYYNDYYAYGGWGSWYGPGWPYWYDPYFSSPGFVVVKQQNVASAQPTVVTPSTR
jgi:hypothetical protein